ncbi:MAG: ribonuclease P protein component [Nitrospirae bacterium]|nr:ribonuclease P protein component [Nitrospirota bacterium]
MLKGPGRRSGAFVAMSFRARESATETRIGISVSRRVGSAVARNYMRRVIRECLRSCSEPRGPLDIVIVVRRAFGRREFRSVCDEVGDMVSAAGGGAVADLA